MVVRTHVTSLVIKICVTCGCDPYISLTFYIRLHRIYRLLNVHICGVERMLSNVCISQRMCNVCFDFTCVTYF